MSAKRFELFKDDPHKAGFTVPPHGYVEISVCNLPEGTTLYLNQVDIRCSGTKRWPVLNCCGCAVTLEGPTTQVSTFHECGDYELMADGDIGDATIFAVVRNQPVQPTGECR